MDFASKDEIRELMESRRDYSVSVYLPTHHGGKETLQDPIRLDNLILMLKY
jgi:hypothetical protein